MSNWLTLAFSPCPNDTFIFHALANHKLDTDDIEYAVTLADVETLNQSARSGEHDISKLSFAALGHLQDKYALLRTGAALGRGCGPLIVARPGFDFNNIHNARIAVPGMWTTAYLLLSLYISKIPDTIPMPFDQIMPAVYGGNADAGVIIHEGRFTHGAHGLESFMDLGLWWEENTSLPIPLGGIAIRRDIPPDTARKVEASILDSIEYAKTHNDDTYEYVRRHAREMEDSVIKQHIDLYVNDFSIDLGEEGERAIEKLFAMARENGLMGTSTAPIFI